MLQQEKERLTVIMVMRAYQSVRSQRSGNPNFRVPIDGSKSWNNALAFGWMAESEGYPLKKLMETGFALYSKSWCMKTFKAPYPPADLIWSENGRNRILKQIPMEYKLKYTPDRQKLAEQIASNFECLGRDTARELIESGVFSNGDEELKDKLLELI